MVLDLFGIKIGGSSNNEFRVSKEYKITKKQLLEKLGFDENNIKFIVYDYKTGILTIKEK